MIGVCESEGREENRDDIARRVARVHVNALSVIPAQVKDSVCLGLNSLVSTCSREHVSLRSSVNRHLHASLQFIVGIGLPIVCTLSLD